jgi:hypothetical protein
MFDSTWSDCLLEDRIKSSSMLGSWIISKFARAAALRMRGGKIPAAVLEKE